MPSVRNIAALALVLLVLAEWSAAMPTTDKDKERLLNTVDVSKSNIKFFHFDVQII